MPTITDPQGRAWRVRVPISLYRQWRDNGRDILDPEFAEKLTGDSALRAEMIIESLERQGRDHGMSFEDIDDMFADNPDLYIEAHKAFEVAYADFSRSMNRGTIAKVIEKTRKAIAMAEDVTMKRMDSPKMDQLIETARQKAEAEADRIMTEAEQQLGLKNSVEPLGTEVKT